MCGICGIYSFNKPLDAANIVMQMAETLSHRGPDGHGFFVNSLLLPWGEDEGDLFRVEGLGNVTLGHRRLSIIDLEGGRQPLCNEDGTVWVTYNGEIYNFKDLKINLEAQGHHFQTHCDTEVIVHAYEQWGRDVCIVFEACLPLPSGMPVVNPSFWPVIDWGLNLSIIF